MIEITAVSDKGLRDKNPIDEFSRYLGKINSKMRPIVGVLNYQIGSRQQDGEVVLGVPEKSQMGAFFRSAPFRAFLDGIRRAPGEPHRYDFECRGSSGCITFRPGATFGSGSYPSFDQINDLRRNHITSRLRKKDQQLRDAKLDLPGIVVLCDGDCAVLKNRITGLGKPRFDEVVDVFLNGRAHQQSGPWVLQQGMRAGTRRINAAVIVAARENHHFLGPGMERFSRCDTRLIAARCTGRSARRFSRHYARASRRTFRQSGRARSTLGAPMVFHFTTEGGPLRAARTALDSQDLPSRPSRAAKRPDCTSGFPPRPPRSGKLHAKGAHRGSHDLQDIHRALLR